MLLVGEPPQRRIMVAGQNIKHGPRHGGKIVTVVIEDTHLRVIHGEEEIAVRPRRNLKPISRFHVTGAGANNSSRQVSPATIRQKCPESIQVSGATIGTVCGATPKTAGAVGDDSDTAKVLINHVVVGVNPRRY
jgi:hypothetical protein